jgi:hypothetical protein
MTWAASSARRRPWTARRPPPYRSRSSVRAFVEGRNLAPFEFRFAGGQRDRLPETRLGRSQSAVHAGRSAGPSGSRKTHQRARLGRAGVEIDLGAWPGPRSDAISKPAMRDLDSTERKEAWRVSSVCR